MVVPGMSGELVFDGVPDEEAWQAIAALPLVMHMPVYGKEPTELTVIKIAYDNDYLYVSGIINYKNPDDIRAFSKKRDYIVYDEGLNSDLARETPRLPLSSGRTVLLKYTYTFMF